MANDIKLKRSATQGKVPTTAQLQLGELALNTYDGKLYMKKNDGSDAIVEIGGDPSQWTTTGNDIYYTTGNVGIGTSSPGSRLHLASSTGGVGFRLEAGGAPTDEKTIAFTQSSTGSFNIQGFNEANGGGGGYWQINRSGNNIQNLTTYRGGTERIKLDSWNSKITFSNSPGYLGTTGDNALVFETNGSEVGRFSNTGNFGIGTSSPGYSLSVNRSDSSTILAGFTGGASAAFLTVAASGTTSNAVRLGATGDDGVLWAGGSEVVRLNSSGNVGIGTTSPTSILTVRQSGEDAIFNIQRTDAATAGGLLFASGNNSNYIVNGGTKDFYIATSGSERMRIDSSGNVGIGATSPGKKLHVSAGSSSGILLEDTSTSGAAPDIEVIGKRSDGNSSPSFGGKLLLAKNRTDAAIGSSNSIGTVLFGGNHTDGSTSNILYTASIGGVSEGTFNSSADMPTGLAFYTGSTGLTSATANTTFGTERMRIDSDGNVGIGTSSPGAKLHIEEGTAGANDTPEIKISSFRPALRLEDKSTSQNSAEICGDNALIFRVSVPVDDDTALTEHMRVTANGNVGIGTSSPGKDLDVNGEIRASTGILFGSDTAAANTLDDYEEGTWTPTYFGASTAGSYTATTSATYTKVGNLVTVSATLTNITTVSAGTGGLRIGGLPFAAGTSAAVGSVVLSEFNVLDTTVSLSVNTTSATTSLRVLETPDGAAASQATVTDKQNNNADIYLTITYEV
jgi:hypothetical protein